MSKVYEKYRLPDTDDGLFLKVADGSIYGPEEFSVIYRWVTEGRIAAGDLLSADRRFWVPAEQVDKFRMEWVADMGAGQVFGPFNLLAVPNLVRSGAFPVDVKLLNMENGKSMEVEKVLQEQDGTAATGDLKIPSQTPEFTEPGEKAYGAWRERWRKEKEERIRIEAALQQQVKDLQTQAASAEGQLSSARDSLTKQMKEYGELVETSHAKQAQLNYRIIQLQAERDSAGVIVDELKKSMERERIDRASIQAAFAEREKALAEQTTTLRTASDIATRELDLTRHQLEDLRLKHATANDESRKRESELQARTELLVKQAQIIQGNLESVQREVVERQKEMDSFEKQSVARAETLAGQISLLQSKLAESERRIEEDSRHLDAERRLRTESEAKYAERENSLNNQIEQFRKDIEESKTRFRQAAAELESERIARSETEARNNASISRTEAEADRLRGRIDALSNDLQQAEGELTRAEDALETKDAQIEHLGTQLNKTRGELAHFIEGLRQKETKLLRESSEKSSQLEKMKRVLEIEKTLRIQIEMSVKEREDSLNARIRAMNSEITKGKDLEIELRAGLENQAGENMDLVREIKRLRHEAESRAFDIENMRTSAEEARARVTEMASLLQERDTIFSERIDALQRELAQTVALLDEAHRATSVNATAPMPKETPEVHAGAVWSMKLPDGSIYGPVTLSELRDWTNQCRVAPEYGISCNLRLWIAASDLPALEMKWLVKAADGTSYGPLSYAGVLTLTREGVQPEGASVTNTAADEALPLSDFIARHGSPTSGKSASYEDKLAEWLVESAAAAAAAKSDLARASEAIGSERAQREMLAERVAELEQALRSARSPAVTPPRAIHADILRRLASKQ